MNNSHYSQTTLKQFTEMTAELTEPVEQPVMTAEQQQRFQQSAMNFLSAFEVAVGEPEKTISALDTLASTITDSPEFARFIANPKKMQEGKELITQITETFQDGFSITTLITNFSIVSEISHKGISLLNDV